MMNRTVTLALIALSLGMLGAAPPATQPAMTPEREARIRKLYAEGEKIRVAAVASLRKQIAGTPKPSDSQLAILQQQLKNLEALKGTYMAEMKLPLEVGKMGSIPGELTVLQVVDDQNMVVQPSVFGGQTIWWHGPTAGRVDGAIFYSVDGFEVTGTETYRTRRGNNTVFVLSPVPPLPPK